MVLLSFLFISILSNAMGYIPVPEDAKALLNSLPHKTVTLEFITLKSLQDSDSFKQIKAQGPMIEVSNLAAKAPLELSTDTGYNYLLDQSAPDSPFGLPRIEASQFNLGFSKYFTTGTALGLTLTNGNYKKTYPALFPIPPGFDNLQKSVAELTLSQNLWRDAFGFATRRNLEKGQIDSEIKKLEIDEAVEDWVVGLAQAYYQAWAAQNDVRAAQAGLQRRERLFNITQKKVANGTAEKPDLLQVKSAVVGSKIRLLGTRESLDSIWRQLITTAKFPSTWAGIDPLVVPTSLDNLVDTAVGLCIRNQNPPPPTLNTSFRKTQYQRDSAQLGFEATKNQAKPTLALNLTMGSNGVDPTDNTATLNSALAGNHPHYSAMLNLHVPWNGYQNESNVRQALAVKDTTEAKLSQTRGGFENDWVSTCEQLIHWQEKVGQLAQVLENQKERLALEESRFRYGRVPLINVIQAGDDQTDAETNYNSAQVQYRMTAWKVRKLAGLVKSFVEGLVARK